MSPEGQVWAELCRNGLERAFDVHVHTSRVVLRNRIHAFEDVEACEPYYCVPQALHTLIGRPMGFAWIARMLWPGAKGDYAPHQATIWAWMAARSRAYLKPVYDPAGSRPVVFDSKHRTYSSIAGSYTPEDVTRLEHNFPDRLLAREVKEGFWRLSIPVGTSKFVLPPAAIKRWAPTWDGLRELV